MRGINIGFKLVFREYRRQWWQKTYRCLVLAVIVSIGAILQIVPDAYEVYRVSGHEQADYDFLLSGDLEESDLAALRGSPAVEEVLGGAIWSLRLVSDKGETVRSEVVFVDDMALASRLMPINPDGETFEPGGLVLTSILASQLGVGEGDSVTIDWSDYDIGDPPTVTARVSNIVRSGAEDMAVVDDALADVALTDAMSKLRAKGDLLGSSQPRFTVLYASLAQPVDDSWILATIGGEPGAYSLSWRTDRLDSERQEVARLDDSVYNDILKSVSTCLFAVVALYFCGHRLTSRRKELAVLVAGGASRSTLLAYVLADVLVLIVSASALALLVAYMFFRLQLMFILPGHLIGRLVAYGVVLNVAVMCLGAVLTLWQTRGPQIAKALARVF